jgi:hypothetical protein
MNRLYDESLIRHTVFLFDEDDRRLPPKTPCGCGRVDPRGTEVVGPSDRRAQKKLFSPSLSHVSGLDVHSGFGQARLRLNHWPGDPATDRLQFGLEPPEPARPTCRGTLVWSRTEKSPSRSGTFWTRQHSTDFLIVALTGPSATMWSAASEITVRKCGTDVAQFESAAVTSWKRNGDVKACEASRTCPSRRRVWIFLRHWQRNAPSRA